MSAAPAARLLGEVESRRPLRAPDGQVAVHGWCLVAGQAEPPAVRLATEAGRLDASAPTPRPDVAARLPDEPAAARCGFSLTGRLPAGVHLARFEARLPDGRWQAFKTLTLAVEEPPFAAGVDAPAATGAVTRRVHVEGWALDPAAPVEALTLRYGHQEIPCDAGRPRPDLRATWPSLPQAEAAGFKSRTILSAGRGPLRVRARARDGTPRIARTPLFVDIRLDENHGPELSLAAPRVPLPGYLCRRSLTPERASVPLNVLFVSHGDFTANSTLQMAALARELALAGHACAIAIPQDLATLGYQQAPGFRGLLHADAVAHGGAFPDSRGPDIIHAWTTRESVRTTSLRIREKFGGRLVVQLEDNEQEIRAQHLAARDTARPPIDLTDPELGRRFLEAAAGATVIVDSLRQFVPPGKPAVTIWPAADARYFYPRPVPTEFRAALQLPPGTTLLFYHGNVHAANAAEMRELYTAVLQLNEAGESVRLIRAGQDQVDFLGPLAARVRPYVLALGSIHTHRHLPPLMALADVFVQPGRADAFNDYRFPSKLPEFFALGRPVILPRTNLGTLVRPGIDAYVLDRADAAGIAAAVTALRRDRALYDRLAAGATAFAREHFNWRRSAEALAKFYAGLTP